MSAAAVVVADLGSGNLRSVEKALAAVGARVSISADADAVARADKLVVPGQGAFGACAAGLDRGGGALRQAVTSVIRAGRPFFGICIGMQLLFDGSEESPDARGLAFLPGRVRRFRRRRPAEDPAHGLEPDRARAGGGGRRPAAGVADGACFYFVHSYFPDPARPEDVALHQPARRRILRGGRPGQRVRLPVPPRKEPGGGAGAAAHIRRLH